jgi:hypothetical protein
VPLSLDAMLVQPSNSGSFTGASGSATLPTGTTASSTLLLLVASTATGLTASGFTNDSGVNIGSPNAYIFRKSNVGAGETSWALAASAGTLTRWTVYEIAGLDLVAPVDQVVSTTASVQSGTTVATPTLAPSTTYDGLVVANHATYITTSTTPTTFSGHTNGMTEMDEGSVNDGASKAVDLSVSMKTVQSLGSFDTTATASSTLSITNAAAATIVCYAAEGAKREANIDHFWAFKVVGAAGLGVGNAGSRYFEAVTGSPAITADGLQLTGAASVQNVVGPAGDVSLQPVKAYVARIKFRLDSLSGDLELATLQDAGTGNVVIRYVSASQKIGVKISTGTEVLSDATVTTGQFYGIDLRAIGTTTARTCDWQFDYGAGPVAQTQATFTATGVLGSPSPRLGWSAAQTGTVTYAYAVFSVVAGHYPLGDYIMVLLKPDPAGTLTISGTTANFNVFSANGTMAAWNATTARGAISEGPPPTIGASADGLAQVTAASSDYVAIPMETYQAAPAGSIRAVRMCACGWAAAATAATIGFRDHDGTTEHTLFPAGDPNFDNSTTAPAWVCSMAGRAFGSSVAASWTQAKLDALTFRVGFSTDATPDVGIHAIYAEVAVAVAVTQSIFGVTGDVTTTATYDPDSGGVLGLVTTTPDAKATSLHYEVNASPTDVSVAAASSDSRTLDAPDHPTVNYVAIYPDPEPGSVT